MSDATTMSNLHHDWRTKDPDLVRADTASDLDQLRAKLAALQAENKLLKARITTMASTIEELRRIGRGR